MCGGYMRTMRNNRSAFPHSFRSTRLWLLGALLVSVGALAMAFTGQFAFGLEPCILCLYQRIPYLIVAVVAAIGVAIPLADRPRRWLLALSGLVFAMGAGLAVYHVGIEQHWWTSSIPGCVGAPVGSMSIEDLRAGILNPLRSCDQVDRRLLGLSLAGWNAVASVLLAGACLMLSSRVQERRPE
jgi:disulfide bond formation protein DsbB